MSAVVSFKAESREKAGTGTARATRRDGLVPAILYGGETAPEMISIEARALVKELHKPGFLNKVFDLDLGKKKQRALVRQLQLHPVTEHPLHLDFVRVQKDQAITISVPIECLNAEKSPGLKRGGVLNIVTHDLPVRCLVDNIPDKIEIDLTGLEIGKSIHMQDLPLPKGVEIVHSERNETLITIAAPKGGVQGEAGEEAASV